MASAAIVAEEDEPPSRVVQRLQPVTVRLTTHDVGGISELDFELAARMNDLAG